MFMCLSANTETVIEQLCFTPCDSATDEVMEAILATVRGDCGLVSINRCCPVTNLKGQGKGARCWADLWFSGPADGQ